jgi:hypothetical protein
LEVGARSGQAVDELVEVLDEDRLLFAHGVGVIDHEDDVNGAALNLVGALGDA